MATALIRLGTAFSEGALRLILRKSGLTPDMMDSVLWKFQLACSVFKIAAIAVVFLFAWKKLSHYMSLVEEDDFEEIGRLQEEFLGKKKSSLSVKSISRLLQIWAVILIGAEFVYTVSSVIYRRFTAELMLLAFSGYQYNSFVSVYNLSHGFKYMEMLTAILMGFYMTGIFLDDRKLMIVTTIIAGLFLLAFSVAQMHTISFSGREVGIVWTSVIFHVTETMGLMLFSFYLTKKYRGL